MFDRSKAWAKAHPRFALVASAVVLIAGAAVATQHTSPSTSVAAPPSVSPTPAQTQDVAAAVRRAQRQARRLMALNAPRYVDYLIKGSTNGAMITYTATGGGTGQRTIGVVSEWRKMTVRLNPGDVAYFSAQNQNDYGSLACKIVEFRGRSHWTISPPTWSSGAYAITTCNGTVS